MRVAVVGLGGIAEEHLVKLSRIGTAAVVGICDLSPTLVEAVSERFGVGPGFTDYEAMLEEARPDVVHVLTPPQTRRELVGAALDHGAHVFVEKPIAPSFAEYVEMRDRAAARGLTLVENYNYLFMSAVQRALGTVRSGELGEPVNVDISMGVGLSRGAYRDPELRHFAHDLPGGALRNFASHPASIAVALLPGWRRVAVSQRRLLPEFASTDELRALLAGDRVDATVSITTHSRPAQFWFQVRGTAGTLECDVFAQRLQVQADGSPLTRLGGEVRLGLGRLGAAAAQVRRSLTDRHSYFEGFERLLERFYAALAGGGPPPISIAEMDATNRLVEDLFLPEHQL